jgi:hypothetical protein
MSFSIKLLEESVPTEEPKHQAQYGLITLGSFQERFIALTTLWTAEAYKAHWREAVRRVVETGADSCLITSVHDPSESHMLFWWPMYRAGDRVRVQNGILFFDQLDRPFRIENPYASVPPRRTVTEDGDILSEWEVSLPDLRRFLTI